MESISSHHQRKQGIGKIIISEIRAESYPRSHDMIVESCTVYFNMKCLCWGKFEMLLATRRASEHGS